MRCAVLMGTQWSLRFLASMSDKDWMPCATHPPSRDPLHLQLCYFHQVSKSWEELLNFEVDNYKVGGAPGGTATGPFHWIWWVFIGCCILVILLLIFLGWYCLFGYKKPQEAPRKQVTPTLPISNDNVCATVWYCIGHGGRTARI